MQQIQSDQRLQSCPELFSAETNLDLLRLGKESLIWRSFRILRDLAEHSVEVGKGLSEAPLELLSQVALLWLAGSMVVKKELEVGGLVSFVYMTTSTFEMVPLITTPL